MFYPFYAAPSSILSQELLCVKEGMEVQLHKIIVRQHVCKMLNLNTIWVVLLRSTFISNTQIYTGDSIYVYGQKDAMFMSP